VGAGLGGAAMGAASAGIAKGIQGLQNARVTAAEQNLSGTSMANAGPTPVNANPNLNPANLAKLPTIETTVAQQLQIPGTPGAPPAAVASSTPTIAPTSAPTSVSTATSSASAASRAVGGSVTGSTVTTQSGVSSYHTAAAISDTYHSAISAISDAYPASAVQRIFQDHNFDLSGKSLQHAHARHAQQLGFDQPTWNNAVRANFQTFIRNRIMSGNLYDIAYRGVENHVLFHNPATGNAAIFQVSAGASGPLQYSFVAAFPLSGAQVSHVLAHAGRLN